MPTTRIEIENIRNDAWLAEVEFGGITAFRVNLKAETFHEVMDKIVAAYEEKTGERRLDEADKANAALLTGLTVAGIWRSPEPAFSDAPVLQAIAFGTPAEAEQEVRAVVGGNWRTWKAKVEAAGGTWTNVADAKAFLGGDVVS